MTEFSLGFILGASAAVVVIALIIGSVTIIHLLCTQGERNHANNRNG